jgi:hypothetical protein
MPSFFITFCIRGGTKNENGSETANPAAQPDSHAFNNPGLSPTLISAIAADIQNDIMAAMQTPKNNIWRKLKTDTSFLLRLSCPDRGKVILAIRA